MYYNPNAIDPTRKRSILNMIEVLNNMGYNIVHISDQFFIFSEFIPVEDSIVEITLYGQDVTTIVENALDNASLNDLKKQEMITQFNNIKSRRRVFSPGTVYVKYLNL